MGMVDKLGVLDPPGYSYATDWQLCLLTVAVLSHLLYVTATGTNFT